MTNYISIPTIPIVYIFSQIVSDGSPWGYAVAGGAMGLLVWIVKQERTERREVAKEFRQSAERHISVLQENTEALRDMRQVIATGATKEDIQKLAESSRCMAQSDRLHSLERKVDQIHLQTVTQG